MNTKEIADKLAGLNLKELNEIIEHLKNDHGLVPVYSGATSAPAEAAEEPEQKVQTTFKLIVKSNTPTGKLTLVKFINNEMSIGLKPAKEIIDNLPNAPYVMKENISKEEADSLKQRLLENGAEDVIIE